MISVVIPCYNCENFLHRAIKSVFSQKFTDWELILVNNNSIDNTQRIIDQYVQMCPNKIFGFYEQKKGAGFARNTGLLKAKGDWIQFLDADDELMADKLERQFSFLERDVQIVIGSFKRIYLEDSKSEEFKLNPGINIWQAILRSQAGITSANLYLKEALLGVDGWDTRLTSSQEYDLLFRLLKSGATVTCDTICSALIYEEQNSVSRPKQQNGRDKIIENYVDLRLRIAAYIGESNQWTTQLKSIFSKELYKMMLTRKDASIKQTDRVMKELNLKTNGYAQILQRSKFVIKRALLNR